MDGRKLSFALFLCLICLISLMPLTNSASEITELQIRMLMANNSALANQFAGIFDSEHASSGRINAVFGATTIPINVRASARPIGPTLISDNRTYPISNLKIIGSYGWAGDHLTSLPNE